MQFFEIANYIEASLWGAIGFGFGVYALLRKRSSRRRCFCAAAVFVLFGISDVIEARTGAWWRPSWLFAWKALCVGGLLVLLVEYAAKRPRS